MARYSLEAKIEQAERSVKICKFNIENQKKKLEELYLKINAIQNEIEINNPSSLPKHEKLIVLQKKLISLAKRQKSVIPELKRELEKAESYLKNLKSDKI